MEGGGDACAAIAAKGACKGEKRWLRGTAQRPVDTGSRGLCQAVSPRPGSWCRTSPAPADQSSGAARHLSRRMGRIFLRLSFPQKRYGTRAVERTTAGRATGTGRMLERRFRAQPRLAGQAHRSTASPSGLAPFLQVRIAIASSAGCLYSRSGLAAPWDGQAAYGSAKPSSCMIAVS